MQKSTGNVGHDNICSFALFNHTGSDQVATTWPVQIRRPEFANIKDVLREGKKCEQVFY